MGCDIHGPEIWARHKMSHGYWTDHVATLDWQRDYLLFAIIANVRNDGRVAPVVEARGFPDADWWSMSFDKARFGYPTEAVSSDEGTEGCCRIHAHVYDDDCHSASWLTIDEVAEAQRKYVRYSDNRTGSHDLAQALALMTVEKERDPDADIRLLFCFDN